MAADKLFGWDLCVKGRSEEGGAKRAEEKRVEGSKADAVM